MIKIIGRAVFYPLLLVVIGTVALNAGDPIHEEHWGQTATYKDIKKIHGKISATIGAESRYIKIRIVETSEVNADVRPMPYGYLITIYRGMLDLAENPDQVAVVIGHEFGHVLLGHLNGDADRHLESFYKEKYSDYIGAYLTRQSGYDSCEGADFWTILAKETGGAKTKPTSHPGDLQRSAYLSCDEYSLNRQLHYLKKLTRPFYIGAVTLIAGVLK